MEKPTIQKVQVAIDFVSDRMDEMEESLELDKNEATQKKKNQLTEEEIEKIEEKYQEELEEYEDKLDKLNELMNAQINEMIKAGNPSKE